MASCYDYTCLGCARRVSCLAGLACVCCGFGHWAVALLAATWAIVVALSRAVMGRHYLGDVTAGLLLGIVSTAVITKVSTAQPIAFAWNLIWLQKEKGSGTGKGKEKGGAGSLEQVRWVGQKG